MYYYCTCRIDRDNNYNSKGEGYRLTFVNSEGQCRDCGYYAVASRVKIEGNIVDIIINNRVKYFNPVKTNEPSSIAALRKKKRRLANE